MVTAIAHLLYGPWIKFRWKQKFPHPFRPALRPIQPPVQWILCLVLRSKEAGARLSPPNPHLAPRLRKG